MNTDELHIQDFREIAKECSAGRVALDTAAWWLEFAADVLAGRAARVETLERALERIRAVVDCQAEDEGLWCRSESIVEAYIQQELRRLHAAVEDWGDEALPHVEMESA